jgi:HAMP domain-containing protein
MTEAAQKLQALSPEVAKASQGMADVGKRGGSAAETMKLSAQATEGAVRAAKRFEGVAGALSFSTDSTSQGLMGLTGEANRARIQNAETVSAAEKQRAEVAEAQKKRRQSEAADAQSAQDALRELGNTIMAAFMPIMKALFPIINSVIRGFAEIVGPLFKYASTITANENVMTGLKVAVTGVVAALLAYKAYQIAKNVKSGISGILDRGKDAAQGAIQGFRTGGVRGAIGGLVGGAFGGGGLGKPDGSATNPYYVIVVPGPGGLANALPGAGGGPGGAGGAAGRAAGGLGRFAGLAKGLAGGVGGILGGLALSSASDYAKEKGMEKTGAGLDIASKAASFAGTGAMLGSVVPGLGTVVGGGLGALAGGAYGLYQNFGSLFGNKKPEGKPMTDAAENFKATMNTEEMKRQISQSELDNKKSEKSPMEVMQTEIQMLNKNIAEMLKYTKDMTENTKRTMDGIGKLNPNLFAR